MDHNAADTEIDDLDFYQDHNINDFLVQTERLDKSDICC